VSAQRSRTAFTAKDAKEERCFVLPKARQGRSREERSSGFHCILGVLGVQLLFPPADIAAG
jgi:hypothetical protein